MLAALRAGAWRVREFVLSVAAASTAVQAQGEADGGQLQEVTVSARYTQENLQTTPLAITAVSGVELENRSIANVASLSAAVPNLYTHVGDGLF